jgi:predicted ArsR family transcriptional regulator
MDAIEPEKMLAMVEIEAAKREAGKMKGQKPLWRADDLRTRLRQYDRTPFLTILQQFIESGPSDEAIERMAEKYPEKWVAALAQIARIGGFTEKTESTVNVNLQIGQMSDSQLEDSLRQEMLALGITDAEFEVVDTQSNASGLAPAQRDTTEPKPT